METQASSFDTTPSIQSEEIYLTSSKFESREDLLKSVREFYCTKGYGLSIRASRKDKHVILQCDRSGSYRNTGDNGKRKKSTSTRLINCPFKIKGQRKSDCTWTFIAKNLTHNHEPSTDMSGHPSFRQLSPNKVKRVKEMTMSGIPPRQILSSLRQENPNIRAKSRTIYNLKRRIRRDDLGNRPMISVLFEELAKGGFSYDVLHNQEGRITRLFIAHPLSIKLAKAFSHTFVMDCTYKTNKYKMPLLDIIGSSCFNTSFYSGFVFLEKEDEENYIWALTAFKKLFGEGDQPSVLVTDREFALNWTEFKLFYNEKKDAIEYLNKIWLPWKEKFVSAWTDKYLHLGNCSSSRAEGAHAKLKMYLQVSTGGFKQVKDKISLAVEHEFNEIKNQLASERIQVLHDCNMPFFKELLCRVSHFALKEIYKQYEQAVKGTVSPCTTHLMSSMGLPCSHIIKSWMQKTLPLNLIHPHWRIDTLSLDTDYGINEDGASKFDELLNDLHAKYQMCPQNKKEYVTSFISKFVNEPDILFEPNIQKPKGRPPKAKKKRGSTSTKRDPSMFEYVESSRVCNSSNSTSVFERNNEVSEDINYVCHEDILFDLNAYPDDFMSTK